MELDSLSRAEWYSLLVSEIQLSLKEAFNSGADQTEPVRHELDSIVRRKEGWKISLADPELPRSIRTEIHSDYQQAEVREREIRMQLQRCQKRESYLEKILTPEIVFDYLNRLEDVLAGENATRGNLELSLHIDRIDCFCDGHVNMRLCRLGVLPECIEFLKNNTTAGEPCDNAITDYQQENQITPRRRAKLRVESIGPECQELDAAAIFATDPDRFAGLSPEWFEDIEFDVPAERHWYQLHATEVFQRRQEARLSYGKLAAEFNVTHPTIRAAIRYYLEKHPEAEDNVKLQCGGKRPPKFNLASFGHEARELWEAGMSKLKLADRYGCSSPTIEKALNWSYQQEGRSLPTKAERELATSQKARSLHDQGLSLEQICLEMNMSDVTARRYLRMSFEQEGVNMPDLRRSRPAC